MSERHRFPPAVSSPASHDAVSRSLHASPSLRHVAQPSVSHEPPSAPFWGVHCPRARRQPAQSPRTQNATHTPRSNQTFPNEHYTGFRRDTSLALVPGHPSSHLALLVKLLLIVGPSQHKNFVVRGRLARQRGTSSGRL
ncbi:hypothetical protein FRC09_019987, partial [Ceratobasidium sp. 395]